MLVFIKILFGGSLVYTPDEVVSKEEHSLLIEKANAHQDREVYQQEYDNKQVERKTLGYLRPDVTIKDRIITIEAMCNVVFKLEDRSSRFKKVDSRAVTQCVGILENSDDYKISLYYSNDGNKEAPFVVGNLLSMYRDIDRISKRSLLGNQHDGLSFLSNLKIDLYNKVTGKYLTVRTNSLLSEVKYNHKEVHTRVVTYNEPECYVEGGILDLAGDQLYTCYLIKNAILPLILKDKKSNIYAGDGFYKDDATNLDILARIEGIECHLREMLEYGDSLYDWMSDYR